VRVAHNLRILRKFLFARNGRFCCGNCAALPPRKPLIYGLFFPGNSNVFQGTGIESHSMTCANDVRAAREKHDVSTGPSWQGNQAYPFLQRRFQILGTFGDFFGARGRGMRHVGEGG
jgi:hypothetical protein